MVEDSIHASAEEEGPTRKPWSMPTEVDYYSKMLKSIKSKRYESYAVSRVVHLLDDPEIELVTQKPIRLADGTLALLDLFLPQFNLGIEIDELHHLDAGTREYDRAREQAVIDIADLPPLVHLGVETTDSLDTLKEKTDDLIRDICGWKRAAITRGTFLPFSYGDRYRPEYWRARGRITTEDDIQMPRIRQVLALFGIDVQFPRRGTHSLHENFQVWMPTLDQKDVTPRKDWKNVLSDTGDIITQTQLIDGDFGHNEDMRSVVFAKYKDPIFLDTYYRFLGIFRVAGIDDTGRVVTLRREQTEIDLTPYL
ncbi:AbaSI family restriction endonuclease [Microbacterium phyllosphaerae]|uniref:AbaSI family restriction endonuclease n=1 Tax=Microbacterium phyllosphaerae TaxID=124798 RepID=UPI0011AEB0E3|nr:hypothetical protein [Microbacterium phyllosphaerae]